MVIFPRFPRENVYNDYPEINEQPFPALAAFRAIRPDSRQPKTVGHLVGKGVNMRGRAARADDVVIGDDRRVIDAENLNV